MAKTYTIQQFFKQFPDDDSCLDHLMATRYGGSVKCAKCERIGKFSRIRKMPAYVCAWCGHHIHPLVGTPFEKSRTSLQKWFYALYLFTTSRHGVPAKELQRQLGVTYKCAWRMGHEICKYIGKTEGDNWLSGHVEIDETYIGGGKRGQGRGRAMESKTTVFGMVQRGGEVITRVVPNAARKTLTPHILENVSRSTTLSSDEWAAYKALYKHGYTHGVCNHSKEEWVNGIHHTNSMEGFWSRFKNAIRGTHIHVSRKYLANYLVEFEYRHNLRGQPQLMFDRLLQAFSLSIFALVVRRSPF